MELRQKIKHILEPDLIVDHLGYPFVLTLNFKNRELVHKLITYPHEVQTSPDVIVTVLQVPIACSVTLFEAIALYKGKRVIASKGKEITNWKLHQILLYSSCGIIAGIVGGLLGLGGGFILGPLFLELGIPPQVINLPRAFSR